MASWLIVFQNVFHNQFSPILACKLEEICSINLQVTTINIMRKTCVKWSQLMNLRKDGRCILINTFHKYELRFCRFVEEGGAQKFTACAANKAASSCWQQGTSYLVMLLMWQNFTPWWSWMTQEMGVARYERQIEREMWIWSLYFSTIVAPALLHHSYINGVDMRFLWPILPCRRRSRSVYSSQIVITESFLEFWQLHRKTYHTCLALRSFSANFRLLWLDKKRAII